MVLAFTLIFHIVSTGGNTFNEVDVDEEVEVEVVDGNKLF